MVVLQGVILTYAAYIGESYAIGRVHFILIGAVGLGALFAAFSLLSASASLGKKLETRVSGKHLRPKDAPRLYAFVQALAERLGARCGTSTDH